MQIQIDKIASQAIIGCYPHERFKMQELIIDIVADLYDYNWIEQDKLDTTVDYDKLIDYITKLVPQTEYRLLESLVQYLAKSILKEHLLIQQIKIGVIKSSICGVRAHQVKVNYTLERKFKVALALGSNWEYLPQQQLITAIEILGEYVNEIKIGGLYETKPVGFTEQNNFYNTAIVGYTTLKPEELFSKIKSIEKLMDKKEQVRYGPRIIDIDLILFEDLVYSHNFLTVPHKQAHLRDFVMRPLADIEPNWIYPLWNKTITQLLHDLSILDSSILRKIAFYI